MYEQLIYCIAKEYIVLNTSSAQATRALLPNYEPFRVDTLPEGQRPLFTFTGDVDLSGYKRLDLLEDKPSEATHARIYRTTGERLILELQIFRQSQSMLIGEDWRELQSDVQMDDLSSAEHLNRLLLIGYAAAIAPHRMLKVHASVTMLRGRALLFLGVSGTGKSTHSRLWRRYVPGAELLNDDEPMVRVEDDGSVRVYGCPWSGSTPCYRNESAEVVAFVHLHQSPENKLTKLHGRASFDSLYSSSAFLHSDKVRHLAIFNTVADVLERIPVYRLGCRPDEEAVSCTRPLLED